MYPRTNKSSGNYRNQDKRNQENHLYDTSREDSKSGEKDYQRLHITNIPKEWQESALRNVFSSYGTLVECFLSADKNRRYGLVSYTSHGHAWQAMTELNKTEPHLLNVAIAYKSKKHQDDRPRGRADRSERFNESFNNNDVDLSLYTDRSSNHSNTHHSQRNDMTEIDSVYSNMPEDIELLDDDLSLEMEKLRLIEAQIVYKQRLRSFAVAERRNAESSGRNVRHMTSDGTIVVQSNGLLDAPNEILQTNSDFALPRSSGTAQSSLLKSALCMTCNAVTSLSCAKCRATPYCSDVCSERDTTRHRGQCSTIVELRKGKTDAKDPKSSNTSSIPGKYAQGKPKVEKTAEKNNSGSASNIPSLRQPKTEYRNNITRPQENKTSNHDQNKTSTNSRNQSNNRPRQNNYERNNAHDQPRSFNQRSENTKEADKPESFANEVKTQVQTKPVQPAPVRPTTVQLTPSRNAPVQTAPGKSSTNKIKKTVTEPLSPKNCIADKLNPGDQVVLDVQSTDPSFMIPSGSMLCLAINEEYSEHYSSLFDELSAVCDADNNDYCVTPGNLCCIKNEDAWYRARCLNQTQMALLDAAKVITKTNQPIRKMPPKYIDIVEFCCLLQIAVKCENMIGTIKERKPNGSVGVELMNPDDGSIIGEGTLSRWLPECTVEVIVENDTAGKTVSKEECTAATSEPLLSLSRPPLKNSTHAVIVHVESLDRILLLPCDEQTRREYDNVLHRGALFAQSASPMKVPAIVGQVVLAKFTDNVHYRALVNRINVAQNKYRVEYIEFGNYEVTTLERLVECPPELHVYNEPALVSLAAMKSDYPESQKALEYLNQLKNKNELLIMTLENGGDSAPSGSFVNLTIESTREDVNRAVSRLCKPQWKTMEEKGESIQDIEIIMEDQLSIVKLSPEGGPVRILDSSMLDIGRVACSPMTDSDRNKVLNKLKAAMEAYANSSVGKAQYLPRYRELCIVHYESCWHRALFCEQATPGADALVMLLVDSGALVSVTAASARKMLREFVHQLPAHVVDVYIKGWPSELTPEMMARAKQFLKISDGKETGTVKVTNCVPGDDGSYTVDISDLLAAIDA